MRTLLLLIGLAIVSVSARPAAADGRADAKVHYQKGKSLFDAKSYVDAIVEFKLADQLAPSGVNDYNIALAYDALGDYSQATTYYQSYLTRTPNASNKAEIEARIKGISTKLADAEAEKQRIADEEARKRQPPPDDYPPPDDGGGTTTSTGDPELDRVNAVDVDQVRDQRAQMGFVASAGGGGPAAPPPNNGGAPPPVEQPKKSKPIYKQWWFWVVAGVSAYVLISILASDSSSSTAQGLVVERPIAPMPDGFGSSGGASLFTF
jgi:tetratricopeptide (TPR) repeat protein